MRAEMRPAAPEALGVVDELQDDAPIRLRELHIQALNSSPRCPVCLRHGSSLTCACSLVRVDGTGSFADRVLQACPSLKRVCLYAESLSDIEQSVFDCGVLRDV